MIKSRTDLEVGIDEVGYGPRLGPLVVAAACSRGPLSTPLRIADSKKVFSQAKGIRTLEPAVLGFLQAQTFRGLVERLSARLSDEPWYRADLPLPAVPRAGRLAGAYVRIVEPAEFNAGLCGRNKAQLLFEVVAGLVSRVRREHPGRIAFRIGKHGGRNFYLRDIQRRIDPTVLVHEEGLDASTYEIPGATLSFLRDAEDRHELVALASMIGKYVRECAMRLFNDWWAAQVGSLRRTAGYGHDGTRFWKQIEPQLGRLNLARETVLRLR